MTTTDLAWIMDDFDDVDKIDDSRVCGASHFLQLNIDLNRLRFTLTSCDMAPPEICGWLSISVAAYLAKFSAFGYSKNAIALLYLPELTKAKCFYFRGTIINHPSFQFSRVQVISSCHQSQSPSIASIVQSNHANLLDHASFRNTRLCCGQSRVTAYLSLQPRTMFTSVLSLYGTASILPCNNPGRSEERKAARCATKKPRLLIDPKTRSRRARSKPYVAG